MRFQFFCHQLFKPIKLVKDYKESVQTYARTSVEDDPLKDDQKTATTNKNVLEDFSFNVYDIAEPVGISEEEVWQILHEELCMRNLCVKCESHLLNAFQKYTRKGSSQQQLDC